MMIKGCHGTELEVEEGTYHKLLLDSAKAFKTRSKLKMVICRCLSDCGDNSNIVTLGADIVGARHHSDVDI
jgi:hypothetical protein